jgi:hypothetical protein
MKATTLLFCLVIGLLVMSASLSVAQVVVTTDTVFIPGGPSNAGLLEATINGDTTAAGARVNPMRVYKLAANTIYTQNAAIDIKNTTGVLTIVGGKGGTKPVIILTGINGIDPGMNLVQGSIRLRNIHMQSMFTNDGLYNNNLWVGSTANKLPQFVDCEDCMFEFISLDTFSMDGYTNGAKFRFENCYFRNLFAGNQWWGGRVFYCKQAIDTIWVENCTVTGGGLIFLQQNSLCKFAYFNHNTIINSCKYWLLGVYYLEGYWVNNLFINQNWVGEDYENVATGGQDPDSGMLMGTFNLDTIISYHPKPHINVQPEFLLPDTTIDPAKCGLDKIKAFVSNNILWTDTVALAAYYHNKAVGGFGPYGTALVDTCPSSWLTWTGKTPPFHVVNVPSIWMNPRTDALFNHTYPQIRQKDNFYQVKVTTVTPAIKDAATANQMALWNASMWGVPNIGANDILHSGYIFGDFDATTVPGIKTEDGTGITKFTDLNDNWAQTGTVRKSGIDGFPIGALHWNDADIAAYDPVVARAQVTTEYQNAVTAVEGPVSGTPESFELSQNYPNPFNPSTKIDFKISKASDVKLTVYNVLGQQVATLLNEHMSAGSQSVVFDASKLSSGVYFYKLEAGDFRSIKKMMLLK